MSRSSVAAWLLAVAFIILAAPRLPTLWPNFDEGVYTLQAGLVRQGQVPYVDFFYHQPPLYLYVLATLGRFGPDPVTAGRFLSLAATALCGVVVMHAGRRLAGAAVGLVAQLAFYAAPLQVYGMLALPNAAMVLLSATGIFAAVFCERRRWAALGGVCLALAVLVKPLDVPAVLATLATLAAFRDQRRKLPVLVASGLAAGLAAWLAFHVASHGGFTETLLLQARRYAGRSGFELMSHYADFRTAMIDREADTPLQWNLSEHARAFLTHGLFNGNLLLLVTAAASPFCGLRRLPRHAAAMLVLWPATTLLFSLFVWEPVWDHYFVQYLPPLSLLAGITLAAGLRARRWAWRAATIPLLAGCTILGHTQRFGDPAFYARAREIVAQANGTRVVTFNPLIPAVTGTMPACGLADPLNVFGEHSVIALSPDGPLQRFRVDTNDLIRCLGGEGTMVIDRYAYWFMEPRLATYLRRTSERLVFFTPEDRRRLRLPPAAP